MPSIEHNGVQGSENMLLDEKKLISMNTLVASFGKESDYSGFNITRSVVHGVSHEDIGDSNDHVGNGGHAGHSGRDGAPIDERLEVIEWMKHVPALHMSKVSSSCILNMGLGINDIKACFLEKVVTRGSVICNSFVRFAKIRQSILSDCIVESCDFSSLGEIILKNCIVLNSVIPANVSCMGCTLLNCIALSNHRLIKCKTFNTLYINVTVIGRHAQEEILYPSRLSKDKELNEFVASIVAGGKESITNWGNFTLCGKSGIFAPGTYRVGEMSTDILFPCGLEPGSFSIFSSDKIPGTVEYFDFEDISKLEYPEGLILGGHLVAGSSNVFCLEIRRNNSYVRVHLTGEQICTSHYPSQISFKPFKVVQRSSSGLGRSFVYVQNLKEYTEHVNPDLFRILMYVNTWLDKAVPTAVVSGDLNIDEGSLFADTIVSGTKNYPSHICF